MTRTQQLNILIVDDSPEDRATYRRYLLQDSEYQYRILEEETGEGGLALCRLEQPDLILLDFLLPDLDGLEFLKELQQFDITQPSVVMLTGQGDESVAVQAIKRGAQDYLIKGKTTSETLRLAVRSVIKNARLQQELQQSQAALKQQLESERIVKQIAQQIRQSLKLQEILNTTVELVRQFLNTDRVILFHLEPDGCGNVVVESVGPSWRSILSQRLYEPCLVESYIGPYLQGLVTAKTDVYNAGLDPCHLNLLARFQVRANLVVPIVLNVADQTQHSEIHYPSCPTPQLWGLLIAHHCAAPRPWQPLEIALLQQLATQVGIAIQQANLYQQAQSELAERKRVEAAREQLLLRERRYSEQLQGLTVAALAINSLLSVDEVLREITDRARIIIGTHRAITSMTVSGEGQAINAVSLSDKYAAWQDYDEPDSDIYTYACQLNRSMRMTQTQMEAHPQWRGANQYPPRGWLAAPLQGRDGRNIGLIQLSNKYEGEFTAEDEAILVQLAQMASVAIENTRLYEAEQQARAEAEAANRVKDEFLAVLSHELRSPLNPILGWSRLLQTRSFEKTKMMEALSTIERNAKLQAQLIEDLLDVSRILRGKLVLNVAPVDLAATILAALETVRLAAEAKSIQIQTVLDPVGQVMGDTNRLQQVVWNLLSNAVKFTPNGGQVEVRLSVVSENVVDAREYVGGSSLLPTTYHLPPTKYAQITVSDTGKGISPDFLPHVFDYFRQADSTTTRKFGGLGLGLAIVRQIVELHGGNVFADSLGDGQGATFTVLLPLEQKSQEQSSYSSSWDLNDPLLKSGTPLASAPPDSLLTGLRVLVVDDDADSREFITFVLQMNGAEVVAVSSANGALQMLALFEPNVLISDIGMPEADGYMLIRQIRAMLPQREMPAIALTAYAAESDRQQALAAGFQMHVSKPVEPAKLVAVVAALAGRK